jgi:hypothetical protein
LGQKLHAITVLVFVSAEYFEIKFSKKNKHFETHSKMWRLYLTIKMAGLLIRIDINTDPDPAF